MVRVPDQAHDPAGTRVSLGRDIDQPAGELYKNPGLHSFWIATARSGRNHTHELVAARCVPCPKWPCTAVANKWLTEPQGGRRGSMAHDGRGATWCVLRDQLVQDASETGLDKRFRRRAAPLGTEKHFVRGVTDARTMRLESARPDEQDEQSSSSFGNHAGHNAHSLISFCLSGGCIVDGAVVCFLSVAARVIHARRGHLHGQLTKPETHTMRVCPRIAPTGWPAANDSYVRAKCWTTCRLHSTELAAAAIPNQHSGTYLYGKLQNNAQAAVIWTDIVMFIHSIVHPGMYATTYSSVHALSNDLAMMCIAAAVCDEVCAESAAGIPLHRVKNHARPQHRIRGAVPPVPITEKLEGLDRPCRIARVSLHVFTQDAVGKICAVCMQQPSIQRLASCVSGQHNSWRHELLGHLLSLCSCRSRWPVFVAIASLLRPGSSEFGSLQLAGVANDEKGVLLPAFLY